VQCRTPGFFPFYFPFCTFPRRPHFSSVCQGSQPQPSPLHTGKQESPCWKDCNSGPRTLQSVGCCVGPDVSKRGRNGTGILWGSFQEVQVGEACRLLAWGVQRRRLRTASLWQRELRSRLGNGCLGMEPSRFVRRRGSAEPLMQTWQSSPRCNSGSILSECLSRCCCATECASATGVRSVAQTAGQYVSATDFMWNIVERENQHIPYAGLFCLWQHPA
jgi:hypothetical protein